MNTHEKVIIRNADDNILAVLEPEIQRLIAEAKEAGFSMDETIAALEATVQMQKTAFQENTVPPTEHREAAPT